LTLDATATDSAPGEEGRTSDMGAPSVGIFGLTGCAGDQLVILNCEDQLLDILRALEVKDFLMASSSNDEGANLDIAFVEGAVLSKRDEDALRRIRERAKLLVAIGTCAVWGGIAAMDRGMDREALLRDVYGETGLEFDTVPAKALHEVVKVDLEITGCPIEPGELLAGIASLLEGNRPVPVSTPVCAECKMREYSCLLVENWLPCLGPLAAGGCGARCPGLGIPCVACRGPCTDANVESALATYEERGIPRERMTRKLATFAPWRSVAARKS
jgi:sulfhydrogenase subunit delta